jgi:hypothetical protein
LIASYFNKNNSYKIGPMLWKSSHMTNGFQGKVTLHIILHPFLRFVKLAAGTGFDLGRILFRQGSMPRLGIELGVLRDLRRLDLFTQILSSVIFIYIFYNQTFSKFAKALLQALHSFLNFWRG